MSKEIVTINPATEEQIATFDALSANEVDEKIEKADSVFSTWKNSTFIEREKLLLRVAANLKDHKDEYAQVITKEMGKRIPESMAEVEKCAYVCEYYADNAEKMLEDQEYKTDAKRSFVKFEPMGVVFAIMPWNFPFWQVFRCATPAIMAGNSLLLKHASNVPESALNLEKIFLESGAPEGLFQTLLISGKSAGRVVEDPRVRMVSLTGSEEAGMAVASLAGKNIKKTVMELGGSDPFIVLNDADVDKAAKVATAARMIVSGQSCIAAKRFIIQSQVLPKFVELFKANLEKMKIGDPTDPDTEFGPVSSLQTLKDIHDQVERSVAMGAKVVTGGKRLDKKGFYYLPTILTGVTHDMPVAVEETFGPVAAIMSFETDEEAISIANDSRYGLGSSLWTKNEKRRDMFINKLQAGGVFINSMVKSDPRIPFGGTKFSGYGRELSDYGIKEFVNLKSVWIDS